MSPEKRSRFVAYARVSTVEQASEGVSLDAQRTKLRQWADLHDATLTEVISDEGISASTLKRPGLERALEMLRSGEVDGIVVTKLDRLTRSTRDLLGLVDELFRKEDYALVSIAENVDTTTAAGRLVLTILGAMATWERETIGERTSEALRHLQSQGVKIGAEGLGWRYGEDTDNEGRRVVERLPSEEKVVRRIQRARKRGDTLRKIAEALNAEGVPTKRGGRWYASTVQNVLRVAG